ncbi:hypothetical protein EW146_g604 [Bondarzewia mesenterica]|uniref:Uncharacterized protein n=1 Tax=Bondarzewia mesenterica TaxID=1095465 RepID=A0A4S4M6E6_9AGAM|nr:hypothetical protein EW146_g604 [Bondarzewia mesenterica]
MPGVLNRQALESMKRVELQRLCKDHGLKANLKSEALIDLLLDINHPAPNPPPPLPIRRTSSMRMVSRVSGSRARLQSTSSLIIHSESEDDEVGQPEVTEVQPQPMPSAAAGPGTRTRKAKEAQFRLGVGRPAAVGGTGARAITKSMNVSKGRRAKSSKSIKPAEETIPEEELNVVAQLTTPPVAGPSNGSHWSLSPQVQQHDTHSCDSQTIRNIAESVFQELVKPLQETVSFLQRELQQQTSAHAAEVSALKAQVGCLLSEVQSYRRQSETIQQMSDSINQLRLDIRRRRTNSVEPVVQEPMSLSTPVSIPSDSPPHVPDPGNVVEEPGTSRVHKQAEVTVAARPTRSIPFEYPPAPARSPSKRLLKAAGQSALGKRSRDPTFSPTMGVEETGKVEEKSEESLKKAVLRPSRKRARLAQGSEMDDQQPVAGPSTQPAHNQMEVDRSSPALSDQMVEPVPPRRYAKFTVFEGPEEFSQSDFRPANPSEPAVDEDIFTDRDFDFFDSAHLNGRGNPPKTRTANATENQHPFNFAFPVHGHLPVTSTPTPTGNFPAFAGPPSPMFSNFPLPEPPHSPSPAPHGSSHGHRIERAGGRLERNDPFHPFGSPSGSRNPSGSSAADSIVNPSALLRTPPPTLPDLLDDTQRSDGRKKASSNDVGVGLGMTIIPQVEDTPAGPMRRTMYGTELEDDTRFGDFGVEGVATGFWRGGRF